MRVISLLLVLGAFLQDFVLYFPEKSFNEYSVLSEERLQVADFD